MTTTTPATSTMPTSSPLPLPDKESPLEVLSRAAGLVREGFVEEYFDEQPLDMSVKRFKRGKSSEGNKRRPSVIAFASNGFPKTTARKRKADSNGSLYSPERSISNGNGATPPAPADVSSAPPKKCRRTRVIIEEAKSTEETEIIIDEHFRRSLGAEKFKDLFMKNEYILPCSSDEDHKDDGKFIDDDKDEVEPASVDDHFAKALGSDYWQTLNKSIPKSSPKEDSPKSSPKSFEKSSDPPPHESQEENIPK